MKKKRAARISKKSNKNQVLSKPCPIGSHWVRAHSLTVPPSKKNPTGVTTRRAHCARNPASSKVGFTSRDIKKIASSDKFQSKNKPCALKSKIDESNEFNDLIAGWTEYWNDIFKPNTPLDPNFVKALIKSESTFKSLLLADPKNPGSARGLMQVTDGTRVILGNRKGEIKDYYFDLSREDLNDPSTNISAGIRWLFYKRERASAKLGRVASWEEAVAEYKSLTKKLKSKTKSIRDRAQGMMSKFTKFYKRYQLCKT